MAERTTVKLSQPIAFGSRVVNELSFRPVKAGDMRGQKFDVGSMDMILNLAGKLSGEVKEVIDELCWTDLMEVVAIVSGFMGAGPQTGTEESP